MIKIAYSTSSPPLPPAHTHKFPILIFKTRSIYINIQMRNSEHNTLTFHTPVERPLKQTSSSVII